MMKQRLQLKITPNIFNYIIEITSDTLDCLLVMWLEHFGMWEEIQK